LKNWLRRKVELAANGGGNEKNNAFLIVPETEISRKGKVGQFRPSRLDVYTDLTACSWMAPPKLKAADIKRYAEAVQSIAHSAAEFW